MDRIRIGTAGWSVDRQAQRFGQDGSMLERYASVFSAVEVNSSFYRRHRPATWQRWHDAVPPEFSFSVKLPKVITHELQLVGAEAELDIFLSDVAPLGGKLGAILVQLPPRLGFVPDQAAMFLKALRSRTPVPTFLEPRHVSWASAEARALLARCDIGWVHADPQNTQLRSAAGEHPGYFRLHGSPKVYYSDYSDAQIAAYAERLLATHMACWCIFDNTASGAALRDGVKLLDLVSQGARS